MVDVNVSIYGIVMCSDESICKLNIGNGYVLEKIDFEALPFKQKIVDGSSSIKMDYYQSRIIDNGKISFICLKKEESFQVEGPKFSESKHVITADDTMCKDDIERYQDSEIEYLYKQISLLKIFKQGNIGFKDVYFRYSFKTMGIINNTLEHTSSNVTRNIVDNRCFSLDEAETSDCNNWLKEYGNEPYSLLKDCIDEFVWGLEQVDISTGFEQYTTALEMMLLPQNQQGKKQMLANRVSTILGGPPVDIQQNHAKILNYYRFRSESLHDGDGSNISKVELQELEEITRKVLKFCLEKCKLEYDNNSSITWNEIKNVIMGDLISQITILKNAGVLPQ